MSLLRAMAELRRINALLRASVDTLTQERDFALASWRTAVKRASLLSTELLKLKGESLTRVYPVHTTGTVSPATFHQADPDSF